MLGGLPIGGNRKTALLRKPQIMLSVFIMRIPLILSIFVIPISLLHYITLSLRNISIQIQFR